MTREQCEELLFAIQEAYPGRVMFSETAIALWYESLKDIPADIAAKAVKALIQRSKWPPSIAEIRAEAADLVDPLPTAEEAYAEARRVALSFYPGQPITHKWSHPVVQKAAETIGISTMAYSENPEYIGRQFREVYERIKEQEERRRLTQPALGLPGKHMKALRGWMLPHLRVVGEDEDAMTHVQSAKNGGRAE